MSIESNYIPTIGLEIHAELKTKSKMFCGCKNAPFTSKPNENTCPICLGLPGALPYYNEQAIIWTIQLAKVLNCQIAEVTKWDRKHYFYPDLPKGYQISQYDVPIATGGQIVINSKSEILNSKQIQNSNEENPKTDSTNGESSSVIRITRIHLEEDTGKLTHPVGTDYSLVDLNRAGVPLVELVTEPDIKSAREAVEFAREYQRILRSLNIADADMEKGQLRCEINISLQRISKSEILNPKQIQNSNNQNSNSNTSEVTEGLLRGEEGAKLGTKVEIKNLNSFKSVEKAVDYEIDRQTSLLESGESVVQETRGWDMDRGVTFSQRTKETSADYRYFPEPDLLPIKIDELDIPDVEIGVSNKTVDELTKLEFKPSEISLILKDDKQSELVDKILNLVGETKITKQAISLVIHKPTSLKFSAAELLNIAKLDPHSQKQKLAGLDVEKIDNIDAVIAKVLASNQPAVSQFKSGKLEILQYLVGQVMRETRGAANPTSLSEQIAKQIANK